MFPTSSSIRFFLFSLSLPLSLALTPSLIFPAKLALSPVSFVTVVLKCLSQCEIWAAVGRTRTLFLLSRQGCFRSLRCARGFEPWSFAITPITALSWVLTQAEASDSFNQLKRERISRQSEICFSLPGLAGDASEGYAKFIRETLKLPCGLKQMKPHSS